MATGTPRRKARESVISVCLLAVLFLIGLGVFLKQSRYDKTAFAPPTAKPLSQQPQPSTTAGPNLQVFTPNGFKALSEPEFYGPDDLYEKINGKASLYLDSNFRRLSARRFASIDSPELWAELYIYDMGTARNAFAVFSLQRRPDTLDLFHFDPSFAYRTENAVYFTTGPYYVEFVGSSESPQLTNALVAAAPGIEKALPLDEPARIDELGLLEAENMLPGSIKLNLSNAFGFSGLTDTFSARYNIGGQTITAFVSRRTDSRDARTVAKSYHSFLIENGGTLRAASVGALQGNVVDFYDTIEIVFAAGPFVGGVHEADNQQAAENLAAWLMKRLSEAAERKD